MIKQIKSEPKGNTLGFREKNIRNKEGKAGSMLQKYVEKYERRKQNETKKRRENRLRKCREGRINTKQRESKEQREEIKKV